jgi:hypothetical protein
MASAAHKVGNKLHTGVPLKVVDASNLLHSLGDKVSAPGSVLVGFDFPIGLPCEYARRSGITNFIKTLPLFGTDSWVDFFHPAVTVQEIALYRPFYPMYPGGAKRAQLAEQLHIPFSQLYRRCENARPGRRAACPIFWTLGGQQVGKAAISGWREVLQPALINSQIPLAIWPFSGRLDKLIQPGRVIAAETYPAEFYTQLNIKFSTPRKGGKSGKRSKADRAANASALLDWCSKHKIQLDASLAELIIDGFGPSASGEDQFDAVVGLFGMINSLDGWGAENEPEADNLRLIEGWIFGMSQEQRPAVGH